ncbi:hypothetical protein ACSV5S_23290 [Agrobacterium deltaense]|uniref:hypothetical protein n=1 Tax=Agrobacterium deltaense TaxID=1183412 RepID=UPI003FD60831
MKQIIEARFQQMKPENSATFASAPAVSVDGATCDTLEHTRTALLGITNYLEALHAQIQRAAHGGRGLSLVTDGGRASEGQSFS